MKRELKALRTKLGRVIRDIECKSQNSDCPTLERLLALSKRLYTQQPKDKNKLYAHMPPEVACISKGKAHKRYEFGSKVGIATTNKKGFVVGMETFMGNPYDGHTFADTLKVTEQVIGKAIQRAFVDMGYKGCAYKEVDVYRSGQRGLNQWYKKRLHERSHIEVGIGHMKNEGKLGKNWLKGSEGDKIEFPFAVSFC